MATKTASRGNLFAEVDYGPSSAVVEIRTIEHDKENRPKLGKVLALYETRRRGALASARREMKRIAEAA